MPVIVWTMVFLMVISVLGGIASMNEKDKAFAIACFSTAALCAGWLLAVGLL